MTYYKKYSDDDLVEVYNTSMDYSGKIEDDLACEILNRGGIDLLQKQSHFKKQFPKEISRINKDIYDLYKKNVDIDTIKSSITSDLLPKNELVTIIDKQVSIVISDINDKTINTRTIVGSIIGIILSTTICGIIWGYTIIKSGTMYYILLPLLALISYFIIRLLTKQSKNNVVVFIATFLSVFFSVILGIVLYKVVTDLN